MGLGKSGKGGEEITCGNKRGPDKCSNFLSKILVHGFYIIKFRSLKILKSSAPRIDSINGHNDNFIS